MKRIELSELSISNFKGVESFKLVANGSDVKVYGDNATGKTTIFDGFTWLLFGKDSKNRTDFEIKGLDDKGEVRQHGLNHEVEAVFLVDGTKLALKRVFAENWTKKRGSSKETFTGHTTSYYINGVPAKKKEFDEKIDSIISEDVFKLVTNPMYFNTKLTWQQRREILFNITGNVTDEDVALYSRNPKLKELIDKLKGRELEAHRRVISARQKEINKELDRIPIRIDEISLSMPDLEGLDKGALEVELQNVNNKIADLQQKAFDIENGAEVNNKRKLLSEIELELTKIKNEHSQRGQNEIFEIQSQVQRAESDLRMAENKIESRKEQVKHNKRTIADLDKQVTQLRDEWVEVNDKTFTHQEECVCPTCNQELPEEQVTAARQKALEKFNLQKADTLEKLQQQGVSINERIKSLNKEIERYESEVAEIEKEMDFLRGSVDGYRQKLELLESNQTDILDNPQYVAKLEEQKAIEDEIAKLQTETIGALVPVRNEIQELRAKGIEIGTELNQFNMFIQQEDRIKVLEQLERELSAEYEKLEEELFLTEEFTRAKVQLLEERINSKFKFARFKLFKEQINGGLSEACETLYEGVPYNSGLNSAAQINIGLDIINTLNEHYGVQAPIFIDNCESVTKLIDTQSQTISLIVSALYNKLEIQINEKQSA